jgi:hypothetical protein
MNIKVLAWVIIVLIVVLMAVYLFVPKHLDMATGKLTTFRSSDDAPLASNTPVTQITNA